MQAERLQRLPLPSNAPFLVDRVRTLRSAVAALARAFSHTSVDGDARLLLQASDTSPLVHWAMRYGAAIVAIDDNRVHEALALLQGAPDWP